MATEAIRAYNDRAAADERTRWFALLPLCWGLLPVALLLLASIARPVVRLGTDVPVHAALAAGAAGAVILVLALGTFLISGALPQLSGRVSQRSIVQTGLLLEAIAVGGLAATLTIAVPTWLLTLWLFVYGVGVGMATAQLTSLLLSDVPADESGQASGLQSTVRQLGSALGVALLGGLLVSQLASATRDRLGALGLPNGTVDSLTSAVKESAGVAIAGLQSNPATQHAGDAAAAAMVHASRVTTGVAALALAVGLLATFALPRSSSHEDQPEPDAIPTA